MHSVVCELPPNAALERTQKEKDMGSGDWQKEDILEVLAWCEDSADDMDTITTELEFIVVSQLLRECASEIKKLRRQVEELKHGKTRRKSTHVRRVQKGVR